MAKAICVAGDSGTGKSTSIGKVSESMIGLDPKETLIINVMDKPLPFKGSKKLYGGLISEGGNYLATTDSEVIVDVLNYVDTDRPDIINVIVDDAQYTMADEFMATATKKGYEKFNVMAKHAYDIINTGRAMRDNINFIYMIHDEFNEKTQTYKLKTIGKMLDEKVNLAGLFTIVLWTKVTHDRKEGTTKYEFITNKEQDVMGNEIPAKSPFGMFDTQTVPNDLGLVIQKANEYFS